MILQCSLYFIILGVFFISSLFISLTEYLAEIQTCEHLLHTSVENTVLKKALGKMQHSLIRIQELGDDKIDVVQRIQDVTENKFRKIDLDHRNLGKGGIGHFNFVLLYHRVILNVLYSCRRKLSYKSVMLRPDFFYLLILEPFFRNIWRGGRSKNKIIILFLFLFSECFYSNVGIKIKNKLFLLLFIRDESLPDFTRIPAQEITGFMVWFVRKLGLESRNKNGKIYIMAAISVYLLGELMMMRARKY